MKINIDYVLATLIVVMCSLLTGCATVVSDVAGDISKSSYFTLSNTVARVSPLAIDVGGATALHWVAVAGDCAQVEELLNRGADPNALDGLANTPLHWAADPSCMCEGYDWPKPFTPVTAAQLYNHRFYNSNDVARAVSLLIRASSHIDSTNAKGQTPLHLAVLSGNLGLIAALFKGGSNPNLKNGESRTPLHVALLRKCGIETIGLLLEGGCDPNIQDQNGDTALHIAARSQRSDVCFLIRKLGGKEDVRNEVGETPIDCWPQMQSAH